MEMQIDQELSKTLEQYRDAVQQKGTNIIIYGDLGTGKTHSLGTAPKPIVIDSFDPGGLDTLRPEIEASDVIPTDYAESDPLKPTSFAKWVSSLNLRRTKKFYEQLAERGGTYCIDSATTWADSIMDFVLQKAGRVGETPQLQDYGKQITILRQYMYSFTQLPCHCILTAHITFDKDEVLGGIKTNILITGKAKVRIPMLFSEIWVALCKATSKGSEYKFQTQSDSLYTARTRIGRDKFERYEEPNVSTLLGKAGVA